MIEALQALTPQMKDLQSNGALQAQQSAPSEEVEEELFRTIVDTSFWNSILRLYGADASETIEGLLV